MNTLQKGLSMHMQIKFTHLIFFILAGVLISSPVRADDSIEETPASPATTISMFIPLVTGGEDSPTPPPSGSIVVNHTSVALFDNIPPRYLTAARNLRLLFSDRSVGQNISESLDCLAASSWEASPATCRRDYYNSNWAWKTYVYHDMLSGAVPARIFFDPDPTIYNRNNWTYEFRMGTWSELTQNFIQELAPAYINSKDVLSYQFSYLNIDESTDIAHPTNGFFSNNPSVYDIYDLDTYIAQHPSKTFFFWTTSLARSIGTETGQNFNNQMRQYILNNNKILFDVADIESHRDNGSPCYDNRDGVQYCSQSGSCENHANDFRNIPAICQDYTTETDGGHLGSVSAGRIRLAKAFWVLMARIAGWDGVSQ